MTTLYKTLLAVSATGLVAGSIVDFGGFNLNPAWTVALPVGAIAYGLFLIAFMLEKEVAKFDADEAKELKLITDRYPASAPGRKSAAPPIVIQLPLEKFGHPDLISRGEGTTLPALPSAVGAAPL
jgi:hypothetical protein